jgi:uncharacterized protein (DUF2062 family)
LDGLESGGLRSPNNLKDVFSCRRSHDPEPLKTPVKNWLNRRIIQPLLGLLRQGISPQRLALCVALGVVVGNIPILGVSTLLCAAIALAFRLNLPAIQIVQAAMAPTQVLLIIPFVRLGEWILRVPPEPVSIKQGMALLAQGAGHAIAVLWDALLHAGLAWILVAPLAVYCIYKLLTPVFVRAAAKIK